MDRLDKPKDFLKELRLTDSDYQDEGMINHIADLLERYAQQRVNEVLDNKWISVKDELPTEETQVIGYVEGDICPINMVGYEDEVWYDWNEAQDIPLEYEVTHWMPLPEKPNQS